MSCCSGKSDPFTGYSLVQAAKSVIKHFTESEYDAFVTEDEKRRRLDICEKCENITNSFGKKQCGVCSCFLDAKAALKDQECPHAKGNKWGSE